MSITLSKMDSRAGYVKSTQEHVESVLYSKSEVYYEESSLYAEAMTRIYTQEINDIKSFEKLVNKLLKEQKI